MLSCCTAMAANSAWPVVTMRLHHAVQPVSLAPRKAVLKGKSQQHQRTQGEHGTARSRWTMACPANGTAASDTMRYQGPSGFGFSPKNQPGRLVMTGN